MIGLRIYLFSQIYMAKTKKKVWLSTSKRKDCRPDWTGVLTNSVSSKSRAAVVLLRKQQTRAETACRGFSWGCWTTRRVLWSVCPSPPLAERVPVVLYACETESHAALPLYHLGPPPRIHMAFRGIWGHVILQLAQWSELSAPFSSFSVHASPRLTRFKSIKV